MPLINGTGCTQGHAMFSKIVTEAGVGFRHLLHNCFFFFFKEREKMGRSFGGVSFTLLAFFARLVLLYLFRFYRLR